MNSTILAVWRRFLLTLLAPLLSAAALAHDAQDLLLTQDFKSAPPQLQAPLSTWADWLGTGSYDRSGGQPFAAPVPPGLPDDITELSIRVKRGTNPSSSGGVTCSEPWTEIFIWTKFSDGSLFAWYELHRTRTCSDGSVESWDSVLASAGVEDPTTGAWSGWIRSYRRDSTSSHRRTAIRASAGATASLAALETELRPFIGLEHDELEITIGPGGVLDLRGLTGGGGPLFETGGPVLLRCDTVLMDPGVTLTELFSLPPQTSPGASVHELALLGPPHGFFDATAPGTVEMRLCNLGNTAVIVQLSFIDVLAWSWGGPIACPLAPLETGLLVQVPILVPPSAPPGSTSAFQAQATAPLAQPVSHDMLLARVEVNPPVVRYCNPKMNSQGCLPQIGATGSATLTGYDDFVVRASDVITGKPGILVYGFAPAANPFMGGTLCIQAPIWRTPARIAEGNGPGACMGSYAILLDHEFMGTHGFVPGNLVYSQWWSRDPAGSFGVGLSDALMVTVGT